ncbi:TylF/MycF/NovP-related O-methyltransferase [Roseibium sp.]|uniref:TylF/MycF/NovP-related O-methyltransferase n=1 Tax=Roseibium sp. TaxID=1936156 RepID=UPI003B505E2C
MTSGSAHIVQGISDEDVWDFENGYHWFSDPTRLNKALGHYELYKMITGLPGDVVELGVFKGLSLIRFATFRAALEDVSSRRVIGFDAFGKFPRTGLSRPEDLGFIDTYETQAGDGLSRTELDGILQKKGFANYELVEGNVFETLPEFLKANPALRISLLHLDMDVLEPTEFALDLLFDRVVKNGLVVFDDYQATVGATIAADRFIEKQGLVLEKLPFYKQPSFARKR